MIISNFSVTSQPSQSVLYVVGRTFEGLFFELSISVNSDDLQKLLAMHKIVSGREINPIQQAHMAEFVEKQINKQRFLAEKEDRKQAELAAKQAKEKAKLASKQAKKDAELAAKQANKDAKLAAKEANKKSQPRGSRLALKILGWCQEIRKNHPEFIKNKSGQRSLSWALWRLKKSLMTNQCFIKSNHITIRCLKTFLTIEGRESFEKMLQ